MPEQLFVPKLLGVEGFSLSVSLDAEAVNHLKLLSTTSIFDVLLNHSVLFTAVGDGTHFAIEAFET